MADQQFFDARDLGWQIIEQDIRDGTKRTLLHAGLWRARVDVRASATLSPVKQIAMPDVRAYMAMRARATVVRP